ncbi:trace amine-associated receptor 1-like [Sebastes fasciatus]|uniref:trace amine-associated receptor 1-like n=1 Tax=Sebastes fasciatus TaxID=394691 RepID=UPI003D9E3AEE
MWSRCWPDPRQEMWSRGRPDPRQDAWSRGQPDPRQDAWSRGRPDPFIHGEGFGWTPDTGAGLDLAETLGSLDFFLRKSHASLQGNQPPDGNPAGRQQAGAGTEVEARAEEDSYVFTSNPSAICVLVYIFLGLLSFATICGNLLVIISILYFKQLHTPTNYLIFSLAVADLLVGVLVCPFSMAFTVTTCLHHEHVICKVKDSFDITLCTSSILHLCCISIDRYYAVCQPLTYRTKINVQVTVIMILVSWGVSVLIGICITIAGFTQGTCEDICSVDIIIANTMGPVLSFYLPAIIMLCIYLKIFLVAKKQVNSIQNTTCQSTKSGATASKMERKATKTLAIVMGVFLLCLTPYFLLLVFQPLFYNPPPIPVMETLNWLTLSNSMLNPLIYAFFYSWFRSAFRMIISGAIFQGDFANSKLF